MIDTMPFSHARAKTLAILLVDDDEGVRESYAAYCHAVGVRARTAGSGEEALALLRDELPDAIVLDYAMPGRNGIDVLNVLREEPDWANIPVLILSGRDRDLQSVHGAPWLRKPLDPPALLDHIRRMVDQAAHADRA